MVDVARRAGVSQKTVSRVVNNAPHVRPDVREKVNQAIEELGYLPNVAARALASQRTHTIGVLAAGAAMLGTGPPALSLEQAARQHGYTLTVTSLPDLSAPCVATGIRGLLARGVEGLVIEVPNHLVEVDALQLGERPGHHQRRSDRRDRQPDGDRCRPGEDLSGADRVPAGSGSRDGLPHRRPA